MLTKAWENFRKGAAGHLRSPFDGFQIHQAGWLDDYALFMALKVAHGGVSWLEWPSDLVLRKPEALDRARRELRDKVELNKFSQFLFFRQWADVKQYSASKAIRFVGDEPIFVSSGLVDVWANPDLFLLDEHRRPTVVAGVPPDYFSSTGQLWGNPLYHWEKLKQTDYAWWVARLRATLNQVDLVRLDHFRGFEAYWEVPAGKTPPATGRLGHIPGPQLIPHLSQQAPRLPL